MKNLMMSLLALFLTSSQNASAATLSMGTGVGMIGDLGENVAGFKFRLEFPNEGSSTNFALETGMHFGLKDGQNYWSLPVMMAGMMHFSNEGSCTPYLGLSGGVSLTHNRYGSANPRTDTNPAALFTGGVDFGARKEWFFEIPVGTLSGAFAVVPVLGYHFR